MEGELLSPQHCHTNINALEKLVVYAELCEENICVSHLSVADT